MFGKIKVLALAGVFVASSFAATGAQAAAGLLAWSTASRS
jgi:hypothetical protein